MKLHCHRLVLNACLVLGFALLVTIGANPAKAKPIHVLSNAKAIDMGGAVGCAVLTQGTVSCWSTGWSKRGWDDRLVQIPGIHDAVDITVSDNYACAVLSGGGVRCWGDNRFGQLGNGSVTSIEQLSLDDKYLIFPGLSGKPPVPVAVQGISNAKSVVAKREGGRSHTCAVLADGGVKCWGLNDAGQLGNGGRNNTPIPAPVSVRGISSAVKVTTGDSSCVLLSGGEVKCWGHRDGSVIDVEPVNVKNINNAVMLNTYMLRTCAVLRSGQIRCWGRNLNLMLGVDSPYSSPFAPPPSAAIELPGIKNAVAIGMGRDANCAVLENGKIQCWGFNNGSVLGEDGIGLGNIIIKPEQPISIGNIENARMITVSANSSCALLDGGEVRCWGFGYDIGFKDEVLLKRKFNPK